MTGNGHQTSRWQRLVWALGMGGLFFLVYGSVNFYTAGLGTAPSLYFDWEPGLPFLPWAIVPYMSLDLLFVGAFLLCREPQTLRRLAGRIAFCVVLSAACFLLLPLQFAFPRPETEGLPGLLFALLGLDLPYNQCPSLHVSLAMVIGAVYLDAARGWLRAALLCWFVLIAVSILFVYQHHAIDLAGGALVGLMSCYALPGTAHARVAARYGGLALLLVLAACALGGWGWILLYPALAFTLLALAYALGATDFFRKQNGRHRWWLRFVLAPYLLGAWLNWRLRVSASRGWQEVTPGVLLGRRPTEQEAGVLVDEGVVAVLDLAPELSEPAPLLGLAYRHLAVLDLTPPTSAQLNQASAFIRDHAGRGKVYVHCALGYSRSAAAVVAYLRGRGQTLAEALDGLHRARPEVVIPPYLQQVLAGI